MLRDRIQEVAEANGWSLRELAKRVGVNPRTVQHWVRGEGRVPADTLAAIAEVGGADPGWLLTGKGDRVELRESRPAGVIPLGRDRLSVYHAAGHLPQSDLMRSHVRALVRIHLADVPDYQLGKITQLLAVLDPGDEKSPDAGTAGATGPAGHSRSSSPVSDP